MTEVPIHTSQTPGRAVSQLAEIHRENILILDFGSQYTLLIARRVRESKVYCEIHPFNFKIDDIRKLSPLGIILSGGPASVYQGDAPRPDPRIFELGIPILGICYGMQTMAYMLGGRVERSQRREFGHAALKIRKQDGLFRAIKGGEIKVWMSHSDKVTKLPPGFKIDATSVNTPNAAASNPAKKLYGVQFHPEVVHTEKGSRIITNFVHGICGAGSKWTMKSFIAEEVKRISSIVGSGMAVSALSGGVDSSVSTALVHRAVGRRQVSIFVDNGLLRKGEAERVKSVFRKKFGGRLLCVAASDRFLDALARVRSPERKRKIIGREFINVFEECARKIKGADYLVQGTLYPDVIESVSFKGPSATIKSHHNVGGLPKKMKLKLIEPLRELFKDEVRVLGRELGLPEEVIRRQPFPGPGLAVRIVGPVTRENLEIVKQADSIIEEEVRKAGLYNDLWQSFAVFLPVRSVGVMGDERTYENVIAIRAVVSVDGMTADWARLPEELLRTLSNRIINEVKGINRVVYDISSKPPSTIEWE